MPPDFSTSRSFGRLNPRCHPPGDLTALTNRENRLRSFELIQISQRTKCEDFSFELFRDTVCWYGERKKLWRKKFQESGIEKERPVRFSHFTMQNGCRFSFVKQMYDVLCFESGALFLAICYILEQKPGLCWILELNFATCIVHRLLKHNRVGSQ